MKIKNSRLNEAITLWKNGDLVNAKTILLNFLKAHPKNTECLHALGILSAQENDFDAALTYLEKAASIDADDINIQLHYANILKIKKQFAKAEVILQNILKTNPNYLPALNNLGTVYHNQGDYVQAIECFKTVLNKEPNYVDARYNLGLAYVKSKQFELASSTFNDLLKIAPDHFAAQFQLALLSMLQEDFQSAIKLLHQVAIQHPFHLETQINLGAAYLKTNNIVKAKEHYKQALEINPNDKDIFFNLGVIEMQLGEIDAAIQNYQKALQQDENFFSAHNNLAVAFLNKQHIPLAIKHFELALQMHPENEALIYTVKMLKQNSPTESAPAEYIKSLFDAYADHYDTHLLTALDYQAPPLLLKAVQSVHVNIQPHSLTILDLGCGTGLCGEVFKPFARKLVGIDLSQKMLAEAKLKNIYDELIENNFLSYLQNSQEHYDLIVAADVLVYTGNLTLICNHVHQALANNGIFAFNTEISSNENFHMNQSGRFLHHASYLKLLAEECGFKIVYFEEAVTRLQNNEPVKGYIVCFKRP